MPLAACTIVSNNYLAYARTLAVSFRAQHPDAAFHVLIVDRPDESIDYAAEPFTTTFAHELSVDGFANLAFRYSILELNTALKPQFLRHLYRTTGCPRLLYFDPDILVLAPLDELEAMLERAEMVLTPHVTAPVEDGLQPGEREFLLSGIYNLGFLGVRFDERTLEFLDWWQRRLLHECLHAVERGLFVDQRWMDLAPALLREVVVLRDAGYNVAYWNLVHRSLAQREGRWWVGDRPLRFFHFSGFELDRPGTISKFQDRYTLDDRRDVAPLFEEYVRLLREQGHEEVRQLPYGYGHFANGEPIPPMARLLLQRVDPVGLRWADPFASGDDSYRSWLAAPDEPHERVRLPRIAAWLWETRPDIRGVFPSLRGESRAGFARWLMDHGHSQLGSQFLDGVEESLRSPPPARSREEALLDRAAELVQQRLQPDGTLVCDGLRPGELDLLVEDSMQLGPLPRVPRLAHVLHCLREDLRSAYPDVLGIDRLRFAIWYVTVGATEYRLPESLVSPVLAELPAWKRLRARGRRRVSPPAVGKPAAEATPEPETAWPSRPPVESTHALDRGASPPVARPLHPGVNVFGWVTAATGVGQVCRGSVAALERAGIPHAVWSLGANAFEDFSTGSAGGVGGDGAPFDVDLLHVNADMVASVMAAAPRWATAGRHSIGYWFWELSYFPLELGSAFEHVNEVWAPSRFCLEAFRPICPVELRWVPPAVPAPEALAPARGPLGLPAAAFLFGFAFDALSVPERKNPLGLLDAFERARLESPVPIHLALKVNHPEAEPELVAELERRASSGVTVLAQAMSRQDIDGLFASCDAYVSLHRSEGLGLPIIEAMYLGKPVVATGYGGCMDFLDDDVGWVVPHRLVALQRSYGPYPAGAVWADADLARAAELMVAVATSPEERRNRASAAAARVRELYSVGAAAERFASELRRIQGHPAADAPAALAGDSLGPRARAHAGPTAGEAHGQAQSTAR